jgi:hypothetical protein
MVTMMLDGELFLAPIGPAPQVRALGIAYPPQNAHRNIESHRHRDRDWYLGNVC